MLVNNAPTRIRLINKLSMNTGDKHIIATTTAAKAAAEFAKGEKVLSLVQKYNGRK